MDIFSEGMAAVCRDDSLWGYIDTEGNEVIPCMYNRHVGCFTEGLACVPSNEGNGIKFINKKNETIIDNSYVYGKRYWNADNSCLYESLQSQLAYYWLYDGRPCRLPCFVDGITRVMRTRAEYDYDTIYIDTKGKEVNNPMVGTEVFDACYPIGTDTIISKLSLFKVGENFGMRNRNLQIVIPPIYTKITDFRNGVALFLVIRGEPDFVWCTGDESLCVVKWGYVDEKGNTTLSQKDINEINQCEQKVNAYRKIGFEHWGDWGD